MHKIKMVFQFGWKYLHRYWVRLTAGVVLGILFGLSTASFVWATKTLFDRFSPDATQMPSLARSPGKTPSAFSQQFKGLKVKADEMTDRWLPRVGRALDWRQIAGGILFLPLLVFVRSSAN